MAGAINRLGQWALELHKNADQILQGQKDQVDAYKHIFACIINKGLSLIDTDKARIALPVMDFFIEFIRAN